MRSICSGTLVVPVDGHGHWLTVDLRYGPSGEISVVEKVHPTVHGNMDWKPITFLFARAVGLLR